MRAATTLATLATAVFSALPASSGFEIVEDHRNLQVAGDDEEAQRALMHVVADFKEECMKKHVNYCIAQIRHTLAQYPDVFGGRSDFDFQVNKIREASDEGYNLVALRTNEAETGVVGILGDGMIWYPHPWCTVEQCFEIGPWDCEVGIPLTVEQCCSMIKDTVPGEDINGKTLECYPDPPIGSESNPVNPGRVIIHTDAAGTVVHIPSNE
jgi:hypothetical protein